MGIVVFGGMEVVFIVLSIQDFEANWFLNLVGFGLLAIPIVGYLTHKSYLVEGNQILVFNRKGKLFKRYGLDEVTSYGLFFNRGGGISNARIIAKTPKGKIKIDSSSSPEYLGIWRSFIKNGIPRKKHRPFGIARITSFLLMLLLFAFIPYMSHISTLGAIYERNELTELAYTVDTVHSDNSVSMPRTIIKTNEHPAVEFMYSWGNCEELIADLKGGDSIFFTVLKSASIDDWIYPIETRGSNKVYVNLEQHNAYYRQKHEDEKHLWWYVLLGPLLALFVRFLEMKQFKRMDKRAAVIEEELMQETGA